MSKSSEKCECHSYHHAVGRNSISLMADDVGQLVVALYDVDRQIVSDSVTAILKQYRSLIDNDEQNTQFS